MYEHLLRNVLSKKTCSDSSKGFTLVELLVITIILGILVTIAIPTYFSYINSAKITLAYGALDTVRKTLETYHVDYEVYPAAINFTTGKDGLGRTVFPIILLEQIKNDLESVDSYVTGPDTYTLTIKAKDSEQTVMTLTPQEISY